MFKPGPLPDRRNTTMPVEPSKKISGTPIIRREEGPAPQQKKKQDQKKKEPKNPEKTGTIDIKV
jgi:hypothetical protein